MLHGLQSVLYCRLILVVVKLLTQLLPTLRFLPSGPFGADFGGESNVTALTIGSQRIQGIESKVPCLNGSCLLSGNSVLNVITLA